VSKEAVQPKQQPKGKQSEVFNSSSSPADSSKDNTQTEQNSRHATETLQRATHHEKHWLASKMASPRFAKGSLVLVKKPGHMMVGKVRMWTEICKGPNAIVATDPRTLMAPWVASLLTSPIEAFVVSSVVPVRRYRAYIHIPVAAKQTKASNTGVSVGHTVQLPYELYQLGCWFPS
jgi:hypothetical protein